MKSIFRTFFGKRWENFQKKNLTLEPDSKPDFFDSIIDSARSDAIWDDAWVAVSPPVAGVSSTENKKGRKKI